MKPFLIYPLAALPLAAHARDHSVGATLGAMLWLTVGVIAWAVIRSLFRRRKDQGGSDAHPPAFHKVGHRSTLSETLRTGDSNLKVATGGVVTQVVHKGMPDEEIDLARYKTAFGELDSPSRDEGLWIKAFSESGGDENASRAMYIKLRVEQLRKSAVADAARRVIGQSNAAPPTTSPVPHTPPPPPQGPARVAQTLYDVVGVDRNADTATISEAIQTKKLQDDKSSRTPEDRQRRDVLLQHAEDVLLNAEKRQVYDIRIFLQKSSVAQTQSQAQEQPARTE